MLAPRAWSNFEPYIDLYWDILGALVEPVLKFKHRSAEAESAMVVHMVFMCLYDVIYRDKQLLNALFTYIAFI